MKNFNFNGMDDEEFRKEFMRFLNMYQSGLESFMKKSYNNNNNFMNNPFFGISPMSDEELKNILKDINSSINFERGEDEDGEWEKRSWQSPDGSSSFNSFSRSSYYNPFNGKVNFKQESQEMDTLTLLEGKLKKAIIDENYEDAAKIRDLIKSLEKDNNKEK